jgi:hypothetical protein
MCELKSCDCKNKKPLTTYSNGGFYIWCPDCYNVTKIFDTIEAAHDYWNKMTDDKQKLFIERRKNVEKTINDINSLLMNFTKTADCLREIKEFLYSLIEEKEPKDGFK